MTQKSDGYAKELFLCLTGQKRSDRMTLDAMDVLLEGIYLETKYSVNK